MSWRVRSNDCVSCLPQRKANDQKSQGNNSTDPRRSVLVDRGKRHPALSKLDRWISRNTPPRGACLHGHRVTWKPLGSCVCSYFCIPLITRGRGGGVYICAPHPAGPQGACPESCTGYGRSEE